MERLDVHLAGNISIRHNPFVPSVSSAVRMFLEYLNHGVRGAHGVERLDIYLTGSMSFIIIPLCPLCPLWLEMFLIYFRLCPTFLSSFQAIDKSFDAGDNSHIAGMFVNT